MIEITDLVKRFGRKRTLDGLQLKAGKGEFLAIFGPNGSGKTTLLRLISTLLRPTSGTISVNGFDSREDGIELRRSIGLVSHDTYLYDELTAMENLKFYTRLYGIPLTGEKVGQLETMLRDVALLHRMNDPVGVYSRGMRQRLAIVRATVHDPSVLLLDEPYTGLDKKGCDVLNWMLRTLQQRGTTVLMTTHDLEKGYGMAGRLAVLVGGRLVFDRPKGDIGFDDFVAAYSGYLEAA